MVIVVQSRCAFERNPHNVESTQRTVPMQLSLKQISSRLLRTTLPYSATTFTRLVCRTCHVTKTEMECFVGRMQTRTQARKAHS